jgi:hypothetical protein
MTVVSPQALRFLTKTTVFLLLNLLGLVAVFGAPSAYVARQAFTNGTTESNLLMMPSGTDFDLAMLGSSHGRNFSRDGSHERVEEALQGRFCNLSLGDGGGLVPALASLSVFYARGNSAAHVVYLIDAWVFHTPIWNEAHSFPQREPLALDLLYYLVRGGMDPAMLREYFSSKLGVRWLRVRPLPLKMKPPVESVDQASVEDRLENLYPRGVDLVAFRRYADVLRQVVQLANRHGSRVWLVRPPTLLGDEPGSAMLTGLLGELPERFPQVEVLDTSTAVTDLSLFEDLDHLNTEGVAVYAAEVLRPALASPRR